MESSIRETGLEGADSGVSWAAVLAGAVASLALTLLMLSFGAGMGFAVVSPWGSSGLSASSFKIATGLYFIVVAMISSALGGYLAGRLRKKWAAVGASEVAFRDTAHGFLAWATASVIGALLLAGPANSILGHAVSATTQAASAAASSPADGYVDALLRPNDVAAQGQQSADTRPEMLRLFRPTFTSGSDLAAADRTYVAKVVAARTGLNQADAEKRVNDVIVQAKTDLDKVRKTTMQLAIWLTLSLFIGAFSAAAAAMEGGGLRDGTWNRRLVPSSATSL